MMTDERRSELMQQFQRYLHADAIKDDFNSYLDDLKEEAVTALSFSSSPEWVTENHAQLMIIKKLQDKLQEDITNGLLAKEELDNHDD